MLDFEESGKSSARKRTYQSIPGLDVPIPKASYESWPTAESEKCESKAENCFYKLNDYINEYAEFWLRVFKATKRRWKYTKLREI